MPLYVADYLGDTTHLTTEEHGAYLLILMAMWRAGGRLPCEAAKLARFARLTPAKWARIEIDILAMFDVQPHHIGHKRLERELAKYLKISDERAKAGAAGGKAKALKTNVSASDLPEQTPTIQNQIKEPEIEESPISPSGEIAPQGAKPKRTKRAKLNICPPDWNPTEDHRIKAVVLGLSLAQFEGCEASFREWEFKDGKSDFNLAFHRWLRTEATRSGTPNGTGPQPRGRWQLDRERKTSQLVEGTLDFVNRGGGRD